MRIIAGQAKGHRIKCLPGRSVRPTQDRIREAVFSTLAFRIPGSRVLDLFAGTGAMSLEALSRGATVAVCVEKDRKACQLIKDNSLHCKLHDRITIVQEDVIAYLQSIDSSLQNKSEFDIIFADPPYFEGYYEKLLQEVANRDILTRQGILVVEGPDIIELPKEIGQLVCSKTKKYGATIIGYYEYQD